MPYPFTILDSGGVWGPGMKSSSCALVHREGVSGCSWDIQSGFPRNPSTINAKRRDPFLQADFRVLICTVPILDYSVWPTIRPESV
jgi:hypothetical protein